MTRSCSTLSIVLATLLLGLIPASALALTPNQGSTVGGDVVQGDLPDITFQAVSAGTFHSMALSTDGDVYTWGTGLLGNGTASTLTPLRVAPVGEEDLPRIASIAAGASHSLALADDGRLYAWGINAMGQLGLGPDAGWANRPVPTEVDTSGMPADDRVIEVSAGNSHSVALTESGKVWTWGRNSDFQLGVAEPERTGSPTLVTALADNNVKVVHVYAGQDHTLAIDDQGVLYSWGRGILGQLGTGDTETRWEPKPVGGTPDDNPDFDKWIDVGAGFTHTVGLRESGLYAWGDNRDGELGLGFESEIEATPVPVKADGVLAGKNVVAVAAGQFHSLAKDAAGHAYAWGMGDSGRLGTGSTANASEPVQVLYSGAFSAAPAAGMSDGQAHSIAINTSGEVLTWGWGNSGQLGNGSNADQTTPQEIVKDESIEVTFDGAAPVSAQSAVGFAETAPVLAERVSPSSIRMVTPSGCGVAEVTATQTIFSETRDPVNIGQFTFGVVPAIVAQSSTFDGATSKATLTVEMADDADPVPTLQWQSRAAETDDEWVDIEGATSASLTITVLASTDFRLVAKNCVGDATSEPMTVTVTPDKVDPEPGPNEPGDSDSQKNQPDSETKQKSVPDEATLARTGSPLVAVTIGAVLTALVGAGLWAARRYSLNN